MSRKVWLVLCCVLSNTLAYSDSSGERKCLRGDSHYQGEHYCATQQEVEAAQERGLWCSAAGGGWVLDTDPYNEIQKFSISARKTDGTRDLIPHVGWYGVIARDVCRDDNETISCRFDKYRIKIGLADLEGTVKKLFAGTARASCHAN